MTRGSRKGQRNKPHRLPSVVSSTKTAESTLLPPGVAKLQPDRTVLTTKEIFVAAPVETCFGMIASQLEQPRQWDLIVTNTQPISKDRGRLGATSQVSSNLGGKKLESVAMISRYRPNRAISWVFAGKPKVRQDWRLEPKPHGTMVQVTLAHEVGDRVIGRLLYKLRRRKRLERSLDKTLAQLKAVAESINRNHAVGG